MLSWLARMASACWKPVRRYARMNKDDSNDADSSLGDSLLWSRDLEKHSIGEIRARSRPAKVPPLLAYTTAMAVPRLLAIYVTIFFFI